MEATMAKARRAGAGKDHGRRRRVRYAVVGLGWIAQEAVLPAFAKARGNSVLRALVSDDPAKLRTLGRRYEVRHLYGYSDYERCLEEVDAVFIALPNSLHREYTVRAARGGVHVLCEKPMAITEADCRAMVQACARARVKLMIGYRLHLERATLTAVETVRRGRVGEPRLFQSTFGMETEAGNLRLRPGEGGPLYDIGIYCLNAARNLFGSEPVAVFGSHARGKGARFRRCPEMTTAVLRFPGERLASFTCTFGAEAGSSYELVGTKGTLRMEPAYSHSGGLALEITTNGRTKTRSFPPRDQFAPEIIHFSDCVLKGTEPGPSGDEGLRDVRVLEAIERSARSGRPVKLSPARPRRRPRREQEIGRPRGRSPRLVHADDPRPD
jgi:glucose-fructose oxidoreductase